MEISKKMKMIGMEYEDTGKDGRFRVTVKDAEKIKILAEPMREAMKDMDTNYLKITLKHKDTGEIFYFTVERESK